MEAFLTMYQCVTELEKLGYPPTPCPAPPPSPFKVSFNFWAAVMVFLEWLQTMTELSEGVYRGPVCFCPMRDSLKGKRNLGHLCPRALVSRAETVVSTPWQLSVLIPFPSPFFHGITDQWTHALPAVCQPLLLREFHTQRTRTYPLRVLHKWLWSDELMPNLAVRTALYLCLGALGFCVCPLRVWSAGPWVGNR